MDEMPKGFTCECGKWHEYPLYVAAHWDERLDFTCECGRAYMILHGLARRRRVEVRK